MSKKQSEIRFYVQLDENKFPEKIEWEATDSEFDERRECDALFISLWDVKEKNTMGIDLWTTGMLVMDMNIHVFQTLMQIADTYRKATNNEKVAGMISDFARQFAEATEIIKR